MVKELSRLPRTDALDQSREVPYESRPRFGIRGFLFLERSFPGTQTQHSQKHEECEQYSRLIEMFVKEDTNFQRVHYNPEPPFGNVFVPYMSLKRHVPDDSLLRAGLDGGQPKEHGKGIAT
jgi:hypothetical protein